jgi:hypothetical protein
VFLAFDESALLHEKTLNFTRDSFGTSGLLYYSWINPFCMFALIVSLTYTRFLLALPRHTNRKLPSVRHWATLMPRGPRL